MFTKEDLESMEGYLYSIEELLEYDHIIIFMPEDNYKTIDFSKLRIPKKLTFQVNRYSEEWSIVAFNEYKQPQLTISFNPGKL